MTAVAGQRADERPAVLIVDDEPDNLDMLARALRGVGRIETATDGADALERLRRADYAALVTDHLMPGLTGVELLERAARIAPRTERILVSAFGDADVLTEAINRGHISHFLPKPVDLRELRRRVERAVAAAAPAGRRALVLAPPAAAAAVTAALRAAGITVSDARTPGADPGDGDVLVWHANVTGGVIDEVRRALHEVERVRRAHTDYGMFEMVGRSPAMQAVFEQIERVAKSDATVLVRGETGTGKEMVARLVHSLSARRERPFIAVNCAALPESLVESELFGHERGAFTGAQTRKLGRFERADGGTLFIDEVGHMPAAVQVKLLRVLQERAFERVGGNQTLHVDIRLVTATNLDLEEAIARGEFREDLFYRLNVVPISLPPLRERTGDIPLLVDHALARFQRRLGKEGIRISDRMMQRMLDYDWPGNVRELMNVVERAVALTPSGGVADLPDIRSRGPRERLAAIIPERPEASLRELVAEFERRIIAQALERHGGNRTRAAKELGITRQGLSQKIAKYGL
ncbi:MAG: sigma-54-dependent Fis family transcriptional regulator [Deltaproteobacteria bacterium]|nr:MAG: sigma-54-dependent Fis family transcriptional regulator [Deltaproteobacteria bacterium]